MQATSNSFGSSRQAGDNIDEALYSKSKATGLIGSNHSGNSMRGNSRHNNQSLLSMPEDWSKSDANEMMDSASLNDVIPLRPSKLRVQSSGNLSDKRKQNGQLESLPTKRVSNHSLSSSELSSHNDNAKHSNSSQNNRRKRRVKRKGSSQHDGGKIKVTRNMTNFMLGLLGLVPLLLMYFGHSTPNIPHHTAHHEFMKEQFKQGRNIKPPPLPAAPASPHVPLNPYTPSLLTVGELSDSHHQFYFNNNTNHTVLHFVKSRFMQYQPNLTALGWARLELFKYFCLPSVTKQTTQNFIWLIYTDPDLHPDLLQAMADLLAPYPNYYLIQSLSNHMWKGGQAQNMSQATIFTGDQAQLEAAMAWRDKLPVLETRLDADDALNINYLEEVQRQAIPLLNNEGVQWMYWCVGQELEWNWLGPQGYSADQQEYGIMESKPYEDFCPTPGLTLGYAANTPVDSIYTRRHSVLVERLHTKNFDFCGKGRQGKDCYNIIRNWEYPAFRCRTPTSASMVMTDFSKKAKLVKLSKAGVDPRWEALRVSFGVPRSNVYQANQYMTKHILEIAEEALMGQCTKGHSCSVSTHVIEWKMMVLILSKSNMIARNIF